MTTFEQLVVAIMPRLPAVGPASNRRSRAHQSVIALIRRGNIVRDGNTVRLVALPGPPLTASEIADRKAARERAAAAVRIPPPDDQDEDDIVLGVGRYADWSPRSLLATDSGLYYLTWFASRRVFRERHRTSYRAVCYVLAEHFAHEAQ
jgi:hypothetical protein